MLPQRASLCLHCTKYIKIWFVFIVQTCSKYGYDSLIHSFRWILFADQLLDLALGVDEWFFAQCFDFAIWGRTRKNPLVHAVSIESAMVKHKIEWVEKDMSPWLWLVCCFIPNMTPTIEYCSIYVLCVHVLLQENIQRHHLVLSLEKPPIYFWHQTHCSRNRSKQLVFTTHCECLDKSFKGFAG